jgi:hypothetical protein
LFPSSPGKNIDQFLYGNEIKPDIGCKPEIGFIMIVESHPEHYPGFQVNGFVSDVNSGFAENPGLFAQFFGIE